MFRIVFVIFIIIFIPLAANSFPLKEYNEFVGYALYTFVFAMYLCALTISEVIERKKV